jgi:hypothetical protein
VRGVGAALSGVGATTMNVPPTSLN